MFNEDNVHGQCVECNSYKSGNRVNYLKGLIERIGREKVLRLEELAFENPIKRWSEDELRTIINHYTRKK
jgi:hypothetical protein